MSTAAKTKKAAPKPTVQEIEEFLKLDAERKELDRKSRAIASRTKALHDHFKTHLETKGKTSLKLADYRLMLVEGSPRVGWKDEFIKVEGALRAQELMNAATKPIKVEIQKA